MNKLFTKYCLTSVLLTCLFALPSFAQIEAKQFENAEQKTLYHNIIAELRCLVCQNQNLLGSNAPLAKDIRKKVYQMIINGKTRQDIIDYMVDRYGEFVLYKPRLTTKTFLLWFSPLLLIVFLLMWLRSLYRKHPSATPENLDSEKISRAKSLLKE